MDIETLKYYSENSLEVSKRYDTVTEGIDKYFSTAFIKGTKIIDLGCGNGNCEFVPSNPFWY